MQVFQTRIKLYFLQNIPMNHIQSKLTALIDKGFLLNEELKKIHEDNKYKNYCYDLPFPIEQDGLYRQGKIYTVTIRTIDRKMAEYFHEVCVNQYTDEIKGLTADIRILPRKVIETLYTLTPAVLKDERGYWRSHMSLAEYEARLKANLIKKWNRFEEERMEEDFPLYTLLEFLNDRPVGVEYKNIKLLGDKLRLQLADNDNAQKLAYMSLGTGILEMNSRGFGFVNYRWL